MHHRYLLALAAALAPRLLCAATATYTGPDNGLWSDYWNWSTFQVPTYGTDVLLSSPSLTTTRLTTSSECANLTISPNNILDASSAGSLSVYHTLQNDGLLILGPSSSSLIGFAASGSGSITLDNASCAFGVANSNAITGSGGISFYSLTNTGNITAGPSSILGISGENFTNAASILADSGTITLVSRYPDTIPNTGTLTAAGTGVINVDYTTSLSGGTLLARDNASIIIGKSISNAFISATDNASLTFYHNLDNCTLSISSTASLLFPLITYPGPVLNNVAFQGTAAVNNVAIAGTITVRDSLTLGSWSLADDAFLTGPGSIALYGIDYGLSTPRRLTNLAAIVTLLGTFRSWGGFRFTNAGTVTLSQYASIALDQSPDSFINTGTLIVAPSPSLYIRSPINNNGLIDVSPGATIALFSPILGAGTLRLQANASLHHNYFASHGTAPFLSTLSSLILAGSPGNWQAALDIDNNALAITPSTHDKPVAIANAADQINSGLRYYYFGPGITSYTVGDGRGPLTIALADNADLHLPSFLGTPLDPDALLITAALKGDANLDGNVDLADYDLWFKNVGNPGLLTSRGDFNLDNQIDLSDYDLWYQHVGAPFSLSPYGIPNSPIPIPEPATFAWPLLALLLCRAKRR